MKKIFCTILLAFTISTLAGCSTKNHKVLWLNNDGYLISEDTLQTGAHPIHEDPTSALSSPEGYRYEFLNWKDQNGVMYSNDYLVGNNDIIFTAQYELKSIKYTVTWLNDDGAILKKDDDVLYNSHPLCNLDEPQSGLSPREGYFYQFVGWFDSNGEQYDTNYLIGDSDVTFTARYIETVNTYKVIWINDDNTLIDETSCNYAQHPIHSIPTSKRTPKEGYHFEFANWISSTGQEYSDDYLMPNHDVTFTATFNEVADIYNIYWLNDDGLLIDQRTCEYGEHPTHDTPISTKTPITGYHYEFVNWIGANGDNYSDDYLMPNQDIIFTAIYNEKINSYKITWKNMFGDLIDSTFVDYNNSPVHDIPTKESDIEKCEEYHFEGWYINDDKIELSDYKVTEDVTITAKYKIFNIGGCSYQLNNDKESYYVSGPQSGYPLETYIILDTYKGKPVISVGEDAFRHCEHTNVKIKVGKNVETIGPYSFAYVSFSSIEFAPESKLKVIEGGAFFGAEDLGTIKIPNSLERIEDLAFNSATNFYALDLSDLDHVFSISARAFNNTSCKFLVKDDEMLQEYRTAWPNLADRIIIK